MAAVWLLVAGSTVESEPAKEGSSQPAVSVTAKNQIAPCDAGFIKLFNWLTMVETFRHRPRAQTIRR
jgi:hypothetical protein